jgi:hypothetical protein
VPIPYPNIAQISKMAKEDVPAAKLLLVAIALVMSLDQSHFPNGRIVLERLIQMANNLDKN